MPSVMTIDGAKSRRRRRQRKGLGSSAAAHKNSADSYHAVFNSAMIATDNLLSLDKCSPALPRLIEMAEMAQGFKAHARAVAPSEYRTKVADGMDHAVSARMSEFVKRCVRR